MTSVPEWIRKGSRIPGPPGIKPVKTPKEPSGKLETKLTPRSGYQATRLPKPSSNFNSSFKKSSFNSGANKLDSDEKDDASRARSKHRLSPRRLEAVSDAMFDKAVNRAERSGVSLNDEVDITGLDRVLSSPILEHTEDGVFYNRGYNQDPIFIPRLVGIGDDELGNPDNCYVSVNRSSLVNIRTWAEKEKRLISDELSQLEKKKVENEAELRQEKARNRTLREMFENEKKKWEKMLFDRGDNDLEEEEEEFIEASTEECDKYSDAMLEEDSFSSSNFGYKMIFPGVVITLIAVFYYSLFTSHTPEQPPM